MPYVAVSTVIGGLLGMLVLFITFDATLATIAGFIGFMFGPIIAVNDSPRGG